MIACFLSVRGKQSASAPDRYFLKYSADDLPSAVYRPVIPVQSSALLTYGPISRSFPGLLPVMHRTQYLQPDHPNKRAVHLSKSATIWRKIHYHVPHHFEYMFPDRMIDGKRLLEDLSHRVGTGIKFYSPLLCPI